MKETLDIGAVHSHFSLRFNSEKCKTLHLARNENPGNEYVIHGDILETIESEKDLGLVISNTLNGMNR